MTLASQFNWSSDLLPDSTLPSFEEDTDTSCFLLKDTDEEQTIAEGGLQHDTVASLNNLISASLTPGSTESELIAAELTAELQRLPLEQDIAATLDEAPVPGCTERPSKRSRVAMEFLMDEGAEGAASRFFPLLEHLGPEVAKLFQLVESALAQTFKFELSETGDELEDEARARIREVLQRLGVASLLRTIARQVMKILLTHRLSGDLEGQTEEQPPPYQPLYQPFFQPSFLPSSRVESPPPPLDSPVSPSLPPVLALPPPMAAAQEFPSPDCGRATDDPFDFDFGGSDFERQLSLSGLERSGSFPFPPLETEGVSSQLQTVFHAPPVPSYFPNASPPPSPKFQPDFAPSDFAYPPVFAPCPDYRQSFVPPGLSPADTANFFNYLDPATQQMIMSELGSFQPAPDMRLDKTSDGFLMPKQECPPYAFASFGSSRAPSIHDVTNKSLVIPKFVVPLWTAAQNGSPHAYHEVRVCVQMEGGKEINLYNSIDLCVGAGLTSKQARVNLTKWRKKHPELAGVRGKMDGGVTHQSPFCVPIMAVQSILTEFKRPGLLVYFVDDRGRERLTAASPVCRWPTPFWADQMTQKRNASDLTRSKRKAVANNTIEHFSDDEGS